MVEVSKHLFEKACSDLDCFYLLHPWNKSCLAANIRTSKDAFLGSCKFYSIVYLVQIAMRGKKMFKSKDEWIKMGEYYARSTVLGYLICGTASSISCLLSYIFGNKIRYYNYLMIPNMLNGAAIYLEPPSRRGLVINLFCNLVIEYWLRTLQRSGYIVMNKAKQTFMFMFGSAALFYLMRLEGHKKHRTTLFWLFTPEKVKLRTEDDKKPCPHKESCQKHVFMGFSKLFGAGLAITLARVILPNIRTPLRALSSIRGKHFKMALFFGSYIGIYRAVICLLCRKRGYDSALYALPAGYLAGLSIFFNPNLGFSIASLTAAAKLYSTILYERKLLPENIPLPELLFCISQGILYHASFMHPEVCPQYVFKLMHSVSNGSTEIIYQNMLEAVKRVS